MSDRARDTQYDGEMLACMVVIAETELMRTVGSSVVVTEVMAGAAGLSQVVAHSISGFERR